MYFAIRKKRKNYTSNNNCNEIEPADAFGAKSLALTTIGIT